MLEALLAGKLSREQENMEDILTSAVFGAFRREPNAAGLLRFLDQATPLVGQSPLRPCLHPEVDYHAYEFWPSWPARKGIASCEPDVVIRLHADNGASLLLLIEVKYQSGLSSWADDGSDMITNQLAKEWAHLVEHCRQRYQPWLVFLTSDFRQPTAEINDAMTELRQKAPALVRRQPVNIAWLSWRQLSALFNDADEQAANLRDISRLIRQLKLIYFSGFPVFERLPDIRYRFRRRGAVFDWQFKSCPSIDWRFHAQ